MMVHSNCGSCYKVTDNCSCKVSKIIKREPNKPNVNERIFFNSGEGRGAVSPHLVRQTYNTIKYFYWTKIVWKPKVAHQNRTLIGREFHKTYHWVQAVAFWTYPPAWACRSVAPSWGNWWVDPLAGSLQSIQITEVTSQKTQWHKIVPWNFFISQIKFILMFHKFISLFDCSATYTGWIIN